MSKITEEMVKSYFPQLAEIKNSIVSRHSQKV